MKTIYMAMALSIAACLLLMSPLRAEDNNKDKEKKNTTSPATKGPEKAKEVVRNIQQAEPPKVSTTTRTPAQAAKEYRESGKPPGPQTLKPKEVPSPVDKNNPNHDENVQRGFDKHQQEHKESNKKAKESKPSKPPR
jgi:hypothetical protein